MDVGAKLRKAREARGISIASLSAITRLAPRSLEAIERNDASVFPPGPYARGFVRSYAREIGLDPDQTVSEYFAQFQPPPEAAIARTSIPPVTSRLDAHPARLLVGAGVAAVCVALAVFAWWRPDDPRSRQVTGVTGTAGHLEAVGPAAVTSARTSSPANAGAALMVTLIADAPVWITASADGKRVLFRLLPPGAREIVRGNRALKIRVGNAGAVRWTVGGRDIGTMGPAGSVRTITVTPNNVATVR